MVMLQLRSIILYKHKHKQKSVQTLQQIDYLSMTHAI